VTAQEAAAATDEAELADTTEPGEDETAVADDSGLRCTLCGLRACWTGGR
jgi:hypothetical protein